MSHPLEDNDYQERSKYHIVYADREHTSIAVVEIVPALDYELNDYSVASRESFWTRKEAVAHARDMSSKHGLNFVPDREEPEDNYLD
jgi:hypothetical protein